MPGASLAYDALLASSTVGRVDNLLSSYVVSISFGWLIVFSLSSDVMRNLSHIASQSPRIVIMMLESSRKSVVDAD